MMTLLARENGRQRNDATDAFARFAGSNLLLIADLGFRSQSLAPP